MATCTTTTTTTPSSLMLSYSASSVHSQDIINNPSIISFKPKPLSRTFSLYPLVLRRRERKPCKWVNGYLQREFSNHGRYPLVAAAVAAEAEVAEAVEEKEESQEGEGAVGSATVTPPKPKKGKAALLLKRDRVR